ncbi:hypothetical protein G6F21_014284 [Rhizopus arrhizus]|nr:hypothetical protein G6F21_014284 [Rhizopus arrhizus]
MKGPLGFNADDLMQDTLAMQRKLLEGLTLLPQGEDVDYGVTAREEVWRDGKVRTQPRAELRHEPADEPGMRLRVVAGPGGYRQDAAGVGGRHHAGAGDQALHRNHHDPRHGARR